jgi:hypothetical protein
VVKGTSSLVSNTATGFLGAAGKISKSMGSGVLVMLSKDQRFMRSRERLAKEKNEVYVRPFKDFFHGVFHGVTGVVTDPYYGAMRGERSRNRCGNVHSPCPHCIDSQTHPSICPTTPTQTGPAAAWWASGTGSSAWW